MSTHRRFIEYAAASISRVDSERGILYGVKLLGEHSKNGRRYLPDAMAEAANLYNGKKVFLNHPDRERLTDDRSVKDCIGVVENARFERGGIFGDIKLRKASPFYNEMIEIASEFDSAFGMSHIADGDSRMVAGEEVIERIIDVFSVDLVANSATTAGLFEGEFLNDGVDANGDPVVKDLPGYKLDLELSPDDIDGDSPETSGGGIETPQSVRDLLKHRAILTAICGRDAIDKLAALFNVEQADDDEAAPVRESHRRSIPAEEFAPLIPRKHSHDHSVRWANRLR